MPPSTAITGFIESDLGMDTSPEFIQISAIQPVAGFWERLSDRISTFHKTNRTIYHPAQEPGFAAWCTTWRESDGTLKICLTEAEGDLSLWPPSYDFTRQKVHAYLVTLRSEDGGRTWKPFGEKIPCNPGNKANSDHGFQHVAELPDGRLIRSGVEYDLETLYSYEHPVFDENRQKEPVTFPFTYQKYQTPTPRGVFMESSDGGKSWQQIWRSKDDKRLYVTGLHRLRSGLLVATGAFRTGGLPYGFQAVILESDDAGRTWSNPQIFAENDSVIRGLCEENDFVELADGRLLLINRVVGKEGRNVQMYLSRDFSGHWHTSDVTSPEPFIRTGYPYMLRATDGTIFFDQGSMLLYTCDDGASWQKADVGGFTYYGRLLEPEPGRILSITQNNIGDSPYPWRYDANVLQRSFHYRRTAVFEQMDEDASDARAGIGDTAYREFHLCATVSTGRQAGIEWGNEPENCCYAELVFQPSAKRKGDSDVFWRIGKRTNGKETELRSCYADTLQTGSPAEIQIDSSHGIFKAALKFHSGDWSTGEAPAVYLAMNVPDGHSGKLFLTSEGKSQFSDLRFLPQGGLLIRNHWNSAGENSHEIELDAGRIF